ncbi:MAG TPA: FHA domain-containing protein [Polyangiaceae bacterium]|nr:FHA domain-containing protein [Polyangiaceae bacterium]
MFVARFFFRQQRYVTLTRFRLRFLLQEIDLPQGDTLVGRSANCQVTLDDPLVSREHARIRIEGTDATVEDLGSRNGVQVGGKPIARRASLSNGDRIRIGTQEFVFLAVPTTNEPAARGATRQTGFMCHCANCARAYPAELLACPACGGRDRLEEDTLTGSGQRDWGLELAAEAVARARAGKGTDDLERVLSHARLGLEQRLAEGRTVERPLIDGVGLAAAEVAISRREAGWARWALSIYASLGLTPPASFSELLQSLPPSELSLLEAAAQRALESSGGSQAGGDVAARAALARLLGSKGP